MPEIPDLLTAAAAGILLRERREDRGMTQEQLAEAIGTDKSYISKLEGGVYNVGRSKYFPAVAQSLRLSEADIRAINPAAVFQSAPVVSPVASLSADAIYGNIPRSAPTAIGSALLEAAATYGAIFPELTEYRWQRHLWDTPYRNKPRTASEWLNAYLKIKDEVDPPEPDA